MTYQVSDLPPRLAQKIVINPASDCWLWQGSLNRDHGYGQVHWDGKTRLTHRLVYTLLVGPVPGGLEVAHVRNRGCVGYHCCWPGHLEPVSVQTNRARRTWPAKEECPQRHPMTADNTYVDPRGFRQCRTCRRDRARARKQRASADRAQAVARWVEATIQKPREN